MTNNTWLEADFLEDFKCKCGGCNHTCCSSWKITISKKEYCEPTTKLKT